MFALTAEEVRNMMPSKLYEVTLNKVYVKIKKAAEEDRTETSIAEEIGHDLVTLWFHPQINKPKPEIISYIKDTLESQGFRIREVYEDRQFVLMDLIVSWR